LLHVIDLLKFERSQVCEHQLFKLCSNELVFFSHMEQLKLSNQSKDLFYPLYHNTINNTHAYI